MGAATAAPGTPDGLGPSVDANLSADQISALQRAVQQSRTLATLPTSGSYAFFLELDADSSGQVFNANKAKGTAGARSAAVAAKARITTLQDALVGRLSSVAPGSKVLTSTCSNDPGCGCS